MITRRTTKIIALTSLLLFGALQTIGHPSYQNLFALDPRSIAEKRTDCTICHAVDGRQTDPNFLSVFGKTFRDNGFVITGQMREQFVDLFNSSDKEVGGIPTEVIKMSTEQVIINITVKDPKGKYITGLDKRAFKLMEDGDKQEISDFQNEDAPLAVAVVIDTSGSTLATDLSRINKSVLDLANRLDPDDVLSIYTFGEGGAQQIRDFTSSVSDLKPLLKQLRGQGDSPMYDAVLRATLDLKKRPERRRVLVLISDGADTTSQKTLHEAGRDTFLAGVAIYAIDLVNSKGEAKRSPERQAGATALRQLSEETGGKYITANGGFFTTSRGQLKKIFTDLIDELHKQYTIAYESSNSRSAGRWRTIRVNLEQADLSARTRLGYREGVNQ